MLVLVRAAVFDPKKPAGLDLPRPARQLILHAFTLLLLGTMAFAGDSRSSRAVTPAKQLASIQQAHAKAHAACLKASDAIPTTPEGREKDQALWNEFFKKEADLLMAAVQLTQADPKSDVGFASLEWVLTNPAAYTVPAGILALELAAEHHAANPKAGLISAFAGEYAPLESGAPHPAAAAFLRSVIEKNPHRTARGNAVMALAWQAKVQFTEAEREMAPNLEVLAASAEQWFETVVRDYADCPRLENGRTADPPTLGGKANQELFALRHLRIGKVAPEIRGHDVDGHPFKLSDYRGKVVLINFWGDW